MKQITVQQALPCLADKFVIELANSIQVSQDHIRVQESRLTKFMPRLLDGFTGKTAKHQAQIDKNLQSGLNSAFEWLNALTKEVQIGFLAIETASKKIDALNEDMIELIDYSDETRQMLYQLSQNLHQKYDDLNARILHIEAESRAERQINLLFDTWEVGFLNHLPITTRLYICLERLYFGDFGDYYRQYQHTSPKVVTDLLQLIQLKAIKQLNQDAGLKTEAYWPTIQWLHGSQSPDADFSQALVFMGDWTNVQHHAFCYTASQRPSELPLYLPRILTANKLAQRSIQEMFTGRIL